MSTNPPRTISKPLPGDDGKEAYEIGTPRDDGMDMFGVCIRKEGSTINDTARTPDHLYFSDPQNPDKFTTKYNPQEKKIQEWAEAWTNKPDEEFAESWMTAQEASAGFGQDHTRTIARLDEELPKLVQFEFKTHDEDKFDRFRLTFPVDIAKIRAANWKRMGPQPSREVARKRANS
ncbi:hypothetical protein PG985_013643 [Apiospora marii]|uniref:uncharacterized protein n=1 Tax=Apiospora marii TaxID=335849 RepID=UPI0031328B8E